MSLRKLKKAQVTDNNCPAVEVVVLLYTATSGTAKDIVNVGRFDLLGDPKREKLYTTISNLVDVLDKTYVVLGANPLPRGNDDHYGGHRLSSVLADMDHPLRPICSRSFTAWKCVHNTIDSLDSWDSLEQEFASARPEAGFRVIVTKTETSIILGGGSIRESFGDLTITREAISLFDEYLRARNIRSDISRNLDKFSINFSAKGTGKYMLTVGYSDKRTSHVCNLDSVWYSLHAAMVELGFANA